MLPSYRYTKLIERACPPRPVRGDNPTLPLVEALPIVLERAWQARGLQMGRPWELDESESRQLELAAGRRHPAGGWRALTSLCAGAGILRADAEHFQPALELEVLQRWSEESARRRLAEAFTTRLVPPTTAAGLFLLLDVHPLWGLRIVQDLHDRSDAMSVVMPLAPDDAEIFPEHGRAMLREACFAALGALVALLRSLEHDRSYPLGALAGCVESCCAFGRRHAQLSMRGECYILSPFLSDAGIDREMIGPRAIDYTLSDLFDAWLVPAGAARRFEDGTFSLVAEALEDVLVGELAPDAQNLLLGQMLEPPQTHRYYGVA